MCVWTAGYEQPVCGLYPSVGSENKYVVGYVLRPRKNLLSEILSC